MDKSTKHCELNVFFKNGQRATGLFHVPIRTSSAIRPSDALQEKKNDLLLLTNVTLYDNNTPRHIPAILLPYDSVSYIELPTGWASREEVEPPTLATLTPAPAPIPQPLPARPPVIPPHVGPKWSAGRPQLK